ncbi:MAG: class I SAM-dependent methyltransferase [Planctomycetota bacterium]
MREDVRIRPTPSLLTRLSPARLRVLSGRDGARIVELFDQLTPELSLGEAAMLYRTARQRTTIVEVGCGCGETCVLMGLGSRVDAGPGASLTSIDPFPDDARLRAFAETVKSHDLQTRVTCLREKSADARRGWDGRAIDLLLLNSDTTHHGAKADLEGWAPLVRTGGMLTMYNVFGRRHPGVARAWKETVAASADFGPTRRVGAMAWTERIR